MKKSIVIIIILILIVLGISYLAKSAPAPVNNGGNETEDMSKYFEEQIINLGVKDIGQPIEGFDAELVRLAFPGFIATDFEGVETFEGYYKVNNGAIEFIRVEGNPITSAEKTISSKGYATLLKNVSARLNATTDSKESVDALIEKLNIAEKVYIRIGETATALGVTITAINVEEDSRCPANANCIQAGTVRLNTKLISGLGEANQIFTLSKPVTTETEIVTLVAVMPEAVLGTQIAPKDYVFLFEIQKRID